MFCYHTAMLDEVAQLSVQPMRVMPGRDQLTDKHRTSVESLDPSGPSLGVPGIKPLEKGDTREGVRFYINRIALKQIHHK